jgi:hypothetical protein
MVLSDGTHFNLATTPGGPAIQMKDSGNLVFNYRSVKPPLADWPAFGPDYVLYMLALEAWANALGISGFTRLLDDADYRLAHAPGGPYSTATRLSNGELDVRYALQRTYR